MLFHAVRSTGLERILRESRLAVATVAFAVVALRFPRSGERSYAKVTLLANRSVHERIGRDGRRCGPGRGRVIRFPAPLGAGTEARAFLAEGHQVVASMRAQRGALSVMGALSIVGS